MDTNLSDHVAQVVRGALRDELREQTAHQRRRALLYSGSGAAWLYAGAALVTCLVLLLSGVIPAWAAALLTAALMAGAAIALTSCAQKGGSPAAPTVPGAPPLPRKAPDPGIDAGTGTRH